MIIVTGTKRSGTSMWMQILKAAGYPIVGEPFPRDWAHTIRAGNRRGFYESPLRRGIYFATNPDPRTNQYLCPVATQNVAVKVFVPGLLRTDPSFVHRVIATVRPWREYKNSVERLYRMEHQNREALRRARGLVPREAGEPRMIAPALAWWNENYGLLRDAMLRRYPLHLVSYAQVLSEPYRRVAAALAFVGAGDVTRAAAQVCRELQTQHADRVDGCSGSAAQQLGGAGFDHDAMAVADELYERIHGSVRLDQAFLTRMDRTHYRLMPVIRSEQARVQALRRPTVDARESAREPHPSQPSFEASASKRAVPPASDIRVARAQAARRPRLPLIKWATASPRPSTVSGNISKA